MMVLILQRARDGIWPLLARLVPVRAARKADQRLGRRRWRQADARQGRAHPRREGT